MKPVYVVLTFCTIFCVGMSLEMADRLETCAPIPDLDVFGPTLLNASRGLGLVNIVEGYNTNIARGIEGANVVPGSHFQVHISPALYVFVPLLWIWSKTLLPLLVSSIAFIAATALVIFFYARKVWKDEWAAAGLAVVFLLHPSVHGLVFSGFHELTFCAPFLLIFIWKMEEGDRRWVAGSLLAMIAFREDITITTATVAAIAAVSGIKSRRWRLGLEVFVVSVAYTAVALTLLHRYDLSHGGSGWAQDSLVFSGRWRDLVSSYRLWALGVIFLPLLLVPLKGWRQLAPVAPWVAIMWQSHWWAHQSPISHYTTPVVICVFAATIAALRNTRRRRSILAVMAAAAVVLSLTIFKDIWQRQDSRWHTAMYDWPPLSVAELALLKNTIIPAIEGQGSVAASQALTPLLAPHVHEPFLQQIMAAKLLEQGKFNTIVLYTGNGFPNEDDKRRALQILSSCYRPVIGRNGDRLFLLVRRPCV